MGALAFVLHQGHTGLEMLELACHQRLADIKAGRIPGCEKGNAGLLSRLGQHVIFQYMLHLSHFALEFQVAAVLYAVLIFDFELGHV